MLPRCSAATRKHPWCSARVKSNYLDQTWDAQCSISLQNATEEQRLNGKTGRREDSGYRLACPCLNFQRMDDSVQAASLPAAAKWPDIETWIISRPQARHVQCGIHLWDSKSRVLIFHIRYYHFSDFLNLSMLHRCLFELIGGVAQFADCVLAAGSI